MVEVKKSNDPTAVLKQFGQNAIMDANELLGGFSQEIKKTMIDWITAKLLVHTIPKFFLLVGL